MSDGRVAAGEYLPGEDAEREDVRRRRVLVVEDRLRRRPAQRYEAQMQREVVAGVGVVAQRRTADLEVERRRQKDVSGGEVAVDEAAVGDVLHRQRHLAAHRHLLGDGQRRQAADDAGGRWRCGAVDSSRPEKLLEIALQVLREEQNFC